MYQFLIIAYLFTLNEASLWWGKGCIRFWDRLDQNSSFRGNRKRPLTYNGENAVPSFLCCCRTCFSMGDLGVQVSVRSSINIYHGCLVSKTPLTVFLPIFLKLRRCFLHGVRMCMWFGYTGDSRYVNFAYLDTITYVEVIFHSQHFFSICLFISTPSMSKTVNMKQRVSRGDFSCPRCIFYYICYFLCRSQKSAGVVLSVSAMYMYYLRCENLPNKKSETIKVI